MLSRLVDTSSSGSTIMISHLYFFGPSHCSSSASRTITRAQLARKPGRENCCLLKASGRPVVDVGLTKFSAGLTTRRCCTGARKPPYPPPQLFPFFLLVVSIVFSFFSHRLSIEHSFDELYQIIRWSDNVTCVAKMAFSAISNKFYNSDLSILPALDQRLEDTSNSEPGRKFLKVWNLDSLVETCRGITRSNIN